MNLEHGHSDEVYDSTELYMIHLMDSLPFYSKEVQRETLRNHWLKLVYVMTMTGCPKNVEQEDLKAYFLLRNNISIHKNVWFGDFECLHPIPFNQEYLMNFINKGHIGIAKVKSLACSFVWWPSIDKALEILVKRCQGCQENRPMPAEAPIHPWEWPQGTWQRIHVDFA